MAAAPRISDTPPSSPRQSPLVLDGPGGAGDTGDGIAAFLSSPGRLLSLLSSEREQNKKEDGGEGTGWIHRPNRPYRPIATPIDSKSTPSDGWRSSPPSAGGDSVGSW